MESPSAEASATAVHVTDWAQFLTEVPPWKPVAIDTFVTVPGPLHTIPGMAIKLYCNDKDCCSEKFFDLDNASRHYISGNHLISEIFVYTCRHCKLNHKTFAVQLQADLTDQTAQVVKIGEWPPFGKNPPSRLSRLLGEDSELLTKGLRSESQGLGIAAYAYYRRVVENQKTALIDAVIKVAEATGSPTEMIDNLNTARSEKQFTKAVDMIKEGVPEVIKIKGRNPLILLHDALSDGVHNLSDDECLELAQDIRLVLYALSDSIASALKDTISLHESVKRLERRASKR